MKKVLAIAPHPDDETLGCGGTLLRHRAEGDEIYWLIATEMGDDYPEQRKRQRNQEIEEIAAAYGFKAVFRAGFTAAYLDVEPLTTVITCLSRVIRQVQPDILYVPYRNDVHSDHRVVFDATAACAKSFRYPSIKSVRAYEVLSETEFGLDPADPGFRPNLFVDISPYLEQKIALMQRYQGEWASFPFPRSPEAITAQAKLRGSTAGVAAAEAFILLRQVI